MSARVYQGRAIRAGQRDQGRQRRRLRTFDSQRGVGRRGSGRNLVHQHRAGARQPRRGTSGLGFRGGEGAHSKATWNQKLGDGQRRGRHRGPAPDLLHRPLSRAALSEAVLRARPLLQRLRRQGARRRLVYGLFHVGHVSRREQPADAVAPERIDGMVQALLQDYREGGWMPKWPNPSYTNIMIATHADSVVAEAISKGFHGFDYQLAYAGRLQGCDDAAGRRHHPALARPASRTRPTRPVRA